MPDELSDRGRARWNLECGERGSRQGKRMRLRWAFVQDYTCRLGKAGHDGRHRPDLLQVFRIRSCHEKASVGHLGRYVDGGLSMRGRVDEDDVAAPALRLAERIPHRAATKADDERRAGLSAPAP